MHLVKLIDWVIEVPDDEDELVDKYHKSVKFPIHFKDEKSYWMLECNFKENGDKVGIYITYASQEKFDRDFMYRIYLRDHDGSSVLKSHAEPGIVCINSEKMVFDAGDGYGESKFLTHDDIIKHRNKFCPDGKLHLKIEIYFYDRVDEEENDGVNAKKSVDHDDPLHPFNLIVNHTADVTLKTHDGVELKAHKDILMEKSDVFRKMFTVDFVAEH